MGAAKKHGRAHADGKRFFVRIFFFFMIPQDRSLYNVC